MWQLTTESAGKGQIFLHWHLSRFIDLGSRMQPGSRDGFEETQATWAVSSGLTRTQTQPLISSSADLPLQPSRGQMWHIWPAGMCNFPLLGCSHGFSSQKVAAPLPAFLRSWKVHDPYQEVQNNSVSFKWFHHNLIFHRCVICRFVLSWFWGFLWFKWLLLL